MKKFLSYVLLFAIGVFYYSCSCGKSPTASVPEATGSAEISLIAGTVGSLDKKLAIELDSAYLQLSALGEATRLESFSISGSGQVVIDKTYTDLKVKTWQAKAWTIDKKKIVIHADSSSFAVEENKTAHDTLNLPARYSTGIMKIAVCDSVKEYKVTLNGKVIIDTVIQKNSHTGPPHLDTMALSFDYLPASPAGTADTLAMQVFGDFVDQNVLLWKNDLYVVNVVSGATQNESMNLTWVGPQIGGMDIIVKFGAVGTVTIIVTPNPRPNTTP